MFGGIKRHLEVLFESFRLDRDAARERQASADPGFLPAALEILETPPNPLGRAILWLMLAFLTLATLWAFLGSVDVVASANGKVSPRGQVKLIQAADAGVVRAIRVTEGQEVKAGQALMDLDPTVTAADVEQARQALLSAQIDVARSTALVDYAQGRTPRFIAPQGADPASVRTQQAFVTAKIAENSTALAGLRQEQAQRRGDLVMVDSEAEKLSQQLPLAEDQLKGLEKLQGQGYAPTMRVSEVRQRVIGIRQDLAIRRAERDKSIAAIASVDAQIGKLKSEFFREALDALTEAQANERLRSEELKKASDKAALTILYAPVDGVIEQIQVHTIGGVVKPADPLMVLVPKGAELIVDAQVLNRDAGFVRTGQLVEVKLEAYPFTKYGVVPGRVEAISRDAVPDKELGLVYAARVKLLRPWIKVDGRMMLLEPGLSATAEIRTGQRRIIEYLLSPLAKRVREAGRER
ncbi:hemolysin D [Caulobacter ginsengisoli]|uniref:Membrane fusion protein (MFP) family protein n=1 Tax=Caulobacter ginsengisoli TaxID=400775 RepID=A0ABU0IKD2_9CAUL|nr:HlyD family type I secretion periplasmic adaptor subunit [Caulobacter ginsengisoli]MDQ0462476.1 hemolysin D [Caulobacter ginsengisoli]